MEKLYNFLLSEIKNANDIKSCSFHDDCLSFNDGVLYAYTQCLKLISNEKPKS